MSSRTRVKRWTPTLRDAVRLAWRPALVYGLFSTIGLIVFVLTVAWKDMNDREFPALCLGAFIGVGSMLLGQMLALMRLRALPVFVVTAISVAALVWILDHETDVGPYVGFAVLFFSIAFPCGILSLMHRYELFASFFPAVGYIGSVFVILNRESRVHVWEESKIRAWLPVPLLFLGMFLVMWLVYLAAKQAQRVELWQALSGAAERRISKAQKKNRVTVLPRKNLVAFGLVAVMLFAGVASLSPYLWRTGRGNRDGGGEVKEDDSPPDQEGPKVDADALMKTLEQLANAAKNTLPKLWPLLLFLLLYRPAKRALLLTHLKSPLVPTPPSERIDNLWEYVRIAAEDAGIVPTSSDSIEAIVRRVEKLGRASPALYQAAEIYARTRYGFVVQRGDAQAMKPIAIDAAATMRKDNDAWTTFKVWFRPLS